MERSVYRITRTATKRTDGRLCVIIRPSMRLVRSLAFARSRQTCCDASFLLSSIFYLLIFDPGGELEGSEERGTLDERNRLGMLPNSSPVLS
jgi:hypothetical protein